MVRQISVLPDFEPREIEFPTIPAFHYSKRLADELADRNISPGHALDVLEWMLSVRCFEEMIIALRMQASSRCPR